MESPYQLAKKITDEIKSRAEPRHSVASVQARLDALRTRLHMEYPNFNRSQTYRPFLNAVEAYIRFPNLKEKTVAAAETAFKKIEAEEAEK